MVTMRESAGRILMIVENRFPTDVRVRNESYTLTGAGYKVSVIALGENGEERKEDVDGVTVYRLPVLDVFAKSAPAKSRVQKLLNRVKSWVGYMVEYLYFTCASLLLSSYIALREGFDVVHIHNPPNTLFVLGAIHRLFGKKFVFDHHDLAPELYLSRYCVRDGFIARVLLFEENLCLRLADMVIATNGSYKQIDIERGKVQPDKVFVVRNGPDLANVRPVPPDDKLKGMGESILVYVGVMGPQDGVDYLLRALRDLVYKLGRTDFYCVIIGSGDAVEGLKRLANELKLEDFVWFTGWIPDEDLLRYLSTADICVDPNPSSPLNDVSTWIKVMEYMALGKPIVSFDLKETRITAQEAAIYVPPNKEEEFAKAIVRLMDNPLERAHMGSFGYKRVRDELAWEHVSRNLLAAYESLFSKGIRAVSR